MSDNRNSTAGAGFVIMVLIVFVTILYLRAWDMSDTIKAHEARLIKLEQK